jgi:glycolate oxidase FAD binding subunit
LKKTRTLRSIPFDIGLRDALGERLRVLPDDCARYSVAGVVPKSVALPRHEQDAALALACASAEGAVVALRGAGSKSNRPPTPRAIDIVIDAQALSGIVQHAAADLTVTVGAGTPLTVLDNTLAAAGQFWPCDAPFAQTATVGGTLAANANGALRLRYGALRDLLLGVVMLTPDGVSVRAGSRVVKSVAGYDLHKLMVGSFGTLGLIVEATLKVAPMPQVERMAVARFASAVSASAVGRTLAASNLFPMSVTMHDEPSARRVGALLVHAARETWLLIVRCGGNKRAVARQIDDVADACASAGAQSTAVLDSAASHRASAELRELTNGAQYPAQRFTSFKIVSLPTQLPESIALLRSACPSAELSAQPAAGIVYAHLPARHDEEGPEERLTALFEHCRSSGWNASVASAPDRAFAGRLVAAASKGPTRLLRAVKAAFDPAGVLDPGRLPGGV